MSGIASGFLVNVAIHRTTASWHMARDSGRRDVSRSSNRRAWGKSETASTIRYEQRTKWWINRLADIPCKFVVYSVQNTSETARKISYKLRAKWWVNSLADIPWTLALYSVQNTSSLTLDCFEKYSEGIEDVTPIHWDLGYVIFNIILLSTIQPTL